MYINPILVFSSGFGKVENVPSSIIKASNLERNSPSFCARSEPMMALVMMV